MPEGAGDSPVEVLGLLEEEDPAGRVPAGDLAKREKLGGVPHRDGAVVSALVDPAGTPRDTARATLIDVIDVLAPYEQPAAHV